MMSEVRKIVVVATPISPLIPHVLHELSHRSNFSTTILTRETSISLPHHPSRSHTYDHAHTQSEILHIKTDFSPSELYQYLQGKDALICLFTGSDIHLSSQIVEAATAAKIKIFIPSEYGLDTSNQKIRDLLPPYQTKFEVQKQLRKSSMKWKAIYSGLMLEEALKTDGVMGVDVLWGSVAVFPGVGDVRVAVSKYEDVARAIIGTLEGNRGGEGEGLYRSTFTLSLN